MVPAATCCAAPPPAALEHRRAPPVQRVFSQHIWSQVTDLQSGKLTQELLEGHPEKQHGNQKDVSHTVSHTISQSESKSVSQTVSQSGSQFIESYPLPKLSILHLAEQLIFVSRINGAPL